LSDPSFSSFVSKLARRTRFNGVFSTDLKSFSDLSLQIPKHAEQLVRQQPYQGRADVSLVREKVILLNFVPSSYQVLKVIPPIAGNDMEVEKQSLETARTSEKLPVNNTAQTMPSFPRNEERAPERISSQRRKVLERLSQPGPFVTDWNRNQTVNDVLIRLTGYLQPQLWCIFLLHRKKAFATQNHRAADGFLQKLDQLISGVVNEPLYHASKSANLMLGAVGNFYQEFCRTRNVVTDNINKAIREQLNHVPESPTDWLLRTDPDYVHEQTCNKLAWFWWRAEKLFNYILTVPDQFKRGRSASEARRRKPLENNEPSLKTPPPNMPSPRVQMREPREEMVLPPSSLSQQAQRMTTVNMSSSTNEPKVPVTPFAIKPQNIEFKRSLLDIMPFLHKSLHFCRTSPPKPLERPSIPTSPDKVKRSPLPTQ
jgi:hypothetical protein